MAYTLGAVTVVSRLVGRARRVVLVISIVLAVAGLLDFGSVLMFGAVPVRAAIGPAFTVIHAILFFCAPPAIGNVAVFLQDPEERDVIKLCIITFIAAIVMVFFNVGVGDALYGPDGCNGPYSTCKDFE